MTQSGDPQTNVRAQAADWFARLKTLPVSRETLEQFFEWRRDAAHEAAFEEIERLWGQAGQVADYPAIRRATQSAYDRPHRRPGRRRLAALAVAALALLVVGTFFLGFRGAGDRYATSVGQQSVVALADGSKVTLDTNTKLVVRLGKDARRVVLDHGQAYFTVAHDGARPFTVEAGGVRVVATGTQFDVRRLREATTVTLVEGSVEVGARGADDRRRMKAGQKMVLKPGEAPVVAKVDTAAATAWKSGRIVLDGMTLADAIAEVNRYTARPVELEATRYAGNKVGGAFDTGDVESFVTAATALLPLRAVRQGDGSIHLTDTDTKSRMN